jgi:hypothetical protein
VCPMIAMPPPPQSCGVRFELWGDINNDGKYTLIADTVCGSSELATMPRNMLMLTSAFPDATDAILRVNTRAVRKFGRAPGLLPGTRWMGQLYSLPHQLSQPALLREQLGESPLAFELPAQVRHPPYPMCKPCPLPPRLRSRPLSFSLGRHRTHGTSAAPFSCLRSGQRICSTSSQCCKARPESWSTYEPRLWARWWRRSPLMPSTASRAGH